MQMGNTGAQISRTELVSRNNTGILQIFNVGIPTVYRFLETFIYLIQNSTPKM